MQIEQRLFSPTQGWQRLRGNLDGLHPQFALVFGDRARLEDPAALDHLRAAYPGTRLLLASTSGEISDVHVSEGGIAVTAVALERSRIACASYTVHSQFDSRAAGDELAAQLNATGLVHVFALSDGQLVNGTELARGFNDRLNPGVRLTGGLAGDGASFERTVVGLDEPPASGRVVALGFYGRHVQVGFGSSGGWEPFGDERLVTRSAGNILFELDGQSALRLYKHHLGEEAARLPAAALRFPLCVTAGESGPGVVRTILSIEEVTQSMVFAGDVPLGARVRFMRATQEDLVDGAARAAEQARFDAPASLAICVSCVGRRLVLGEHAAREIERVRRSLGPEPFVAGFYSYGELAPPGDEPQCQLHNQTMTITTLREA